MNEEKIEKDIDAIEKEKKEYLENHPEENNSDDSEEESGSGEESESSEDDESEEVEYDSEETEIYLTESEIDEWINELTRLKEEKGSVEFELDEENTLKINYSEDSEEELDEGESIE